MTIYRRREEYDMLTEPVEMLSDSELRQKVLEVKRMLPQVGESIILGQLRSMGYKVTRWRVREALHSTDPVNVTLRWPGELQPEGSILFQVQTHYGTLVCYSS